MNNCKESLAREVSPILRMAVSDLESGKNLISLMLRRGKWGLSSGDETVVANYMSRLWAAVGKLEYNIATIVDIIEDINAPDEVPNRYFLFDDKGAITETDEATYMKAMPEEEADDDECEQEISDIVHDE